VTVNTAKVTGRRKVRYDSYNDLLRDAERLAAGKVRPLGNWSYGQVLEHLSRAMNAAIDGADYQVSWFIRLVAKLFFKNRALKGPMPAGFKLPSNAAKALVPEQSIDNEAALAMLRQAVHRMTHDTHRAPNVVFGELSLDEWDKLHLRHAEMHMSFLVPE
jgi:hypothetical protein